MIKPIKLDEMFFSADAGTVARNLLGTELVRVFGKNALVRGRIQEVAAYQGEEESSYRGMHYAPGTIGVSSKFGKYLIDIATGGPRPACVTLISALFNWDGKEQLVQGPGNLSRALGIDKSYDSLPINGRDFWIEMKDNYQREILKRRKAMPENCQGFFYIRGK